VVEDPDEPLGLGERQRLEQHPVHDRKDGNICRQAQRQGGNCRQSETAILPEQPNRKAQVLK